MPFLLTDNFSSFSPSFLQSLEQWEDSLREAIAVGPPHISLYDLQVEQGTVRRREGGSGERNWHGDPLSVTFLIESSPSSRARSLPSSLPCRPLVAGMEREKGRAIVPTKLPRPPLLPALPPSLPPPPLLLCRPKRSPRQCMPELRPCCKRRAMSTTR